MLVFELVLALLLGGVALALLAPRIGVPWPALLALAGAALAFVPGMPQIELDPDLALALFLAPVLLDASYDASPRDLRANLLPVGSLVLVAVALTVCAVAWTARALDPAIPWAAAIALGAVVAPPDAAAATSVLRSVKLPHRLMVILEGESLLNDATSLLIYRAAVGAAAGGLTLWSGPLLVLSAVGGVVIGVVLARLYMLVTTRLAAGAEQVVLQFLGTFGVWLLAEAMHLSAVLALVAYGITIARTAPGRTAARARRNAYAVWEVAIFVLNVLAFILVGLQLRGIVERFEGNLWHPVGFALSVLAVVILVRLAWVMTFNTAVRVKLHVAGPSRRTTGLMRPTAAGGLVIGWCGMRGIVTLAAALALPAGFPYRDLILFTAFIVVLGTLVAQGLTLRPLLSMLTLPVDTSVDEELELARREITDAAVQVLRADGSKAAQVLIRDYESRTHDRDQVGILSLRRDAVAAERARLLGLRDEGRIGEEAFHQIEEELDWAEAEA